MKKLRVGVIALLLSASACGVGGQGGDERTILVDFSHDEFASAMFANFPGEVTVPQGATVVFKQTWTGEPHTVTGGTLVDEMMAEGGPWTRFFEAFDSLAAQEEDFPNPEAPEGTAEELFAAVEAAENEEAKQEFIEAYDGLVAADVPLPARDDLGDTTFEELVQVVDEESNKFFEDVGLPWAIDETDEGQAFIPQNAGQPCYLDSGRPPKDLDEACAEDDQKQPVFDGSATYYNSGMVPYEGPQGNTFKVELADDIDPGEYWFYCAVHGPGQSTQLNVVEEGTDVPSQEEISREARREIDEFSKPMLEAFTEARDGEFEMDGETVEGPFGGLSAPVHGTINEFVPRTIETKVDEPVTWKIMGSDHTISFDVPEYFPIMTFAEDGEVAFNPKLQPSAGGSPKIPESEPGPPGTGDPVSIDGGTYDGDGFFSSGLFGGEPYAEYTLRFSEPGTYKYACLLHPPMVGTVEVT